MYEEKDSKFKKGNWLILILKLLLVAILAFILCWLFMRNNKKQTVTTETEPEFIQNINYMKESALEYFTSDRLPQNEGGKIKITLADMLDQKLLIDFTQNGKKCDLNASYIQATKTEDDNYALKVNLKCGKNEDFIVTSIEKKDNVCNTCPNLNENKEPETPDIEAKPNNNNNSNNSSNSSNTTSTNSNKGNSTSSSSSSSSKTTVTKKVIKKVTYKYYNLCDSCTVETVTPTKEKYYELYSYTDWVGGAYYGDNYENKCERTNVYTYCKTSMANFYSSCTIPENYNQSSYTYTLNLTNINSKTTGANAMGFGYYTNLSDYETYLNKKASKVEENTTQKVELVDAQTMMNASLKQGNFTYNPQKFYLENGIYKMQIKIDILNKNGVTPYYSRNLGYNVYFVPVKFSLRLIDYDTCVRDLVSNKDKYPGYTAISNESVNYCQHREKIYKWVKESELNNYLNNGWTKTGNVKEK